MSQALFLVQRFIEKQIMVVVLREFKFFRKRNHIGSNQRGGNEWAFKEKLI